MLKNWFWVALIFNSICLMACGEDDPSSSKSSFSDEEFAARCYERFSLEENSPWNSSLSGNQFLSSYICSGLSAYMRDKLSFYAACNSAEYNEANNRYDIEVITSDSSLHIWAEVSDCKYAYGTDGDLESMVSGMNERKLDACICKMEEGQVYYRDFPSNSVEPSSSSAEFYFYSSSERSSSSQKMHAYSSASAIKTCDECNAFKDARDGNIYRVTEIDGMIWMSEDLRYYDPDLKLAYYIKCNANEGCESHGYLYSFAAAMDDMDCMLYSSCSDKIHYPHRGLCPEGFHIPEHWEWENLYDYINVNRFDETYFNNEVHLRAAEGWGYPGDDIYGFSAVPTGEFSHDYVHADEYARYWTSTEAGSESAYEWYLGDFAGLKFQTYSKNYGYAVRCVADGEVKLTEFKEWRYLESSSSSQEKSSSSSYSSSSYKSSSSIAYSYAYITSQAPDCGACNAFTDTRDGMIYRVAKIAGEIWMADDLRYAGPEGLPLKGATCPGGEDCTKRGLLYTFDAASDACPEGWALPSNDQMHGLMYASMGFYYETCGKMDALLSENGEWGKSCGNASGFDAVPTGEWNGSSFKDDAYARYWTSTEATSGSAYMWYISANDAMTNQSYIKTFGYAVRCVAINDVMLDAIHDEFY